MIRGILATLTDGVVRLFAGTGRPGESFEKREFIQHYGFASAPKAGAELVIHVQGNIVTCIASDDRRYRLSLADGEVALYDAQGQKVHLAAGGDIEVVAIAKVTVTAPKVEVVASTVVTMTTPLLEVSGNITAGGDVIATGNVADAGGTKTMAGMRTTYNSHVHGTSPAPTQQQ